MDPVHIIILIALGCAAGFINALAGGGSILTVPALIFLGLDGATANGSNRIAVIIQSFSAILSFRKEKLTAFRQSAWYGIFTLPGGIAGAILAVRISDATFKTILGILMILIVMTLFIPLHKRNDNKDHSGSWWIYPALFGVGFYGGFIQIGVGFLIMTTLYHMERLNLIYVNMHKVFLMLFFTLPAFLVFLFNGNIHWLYGLILSVGNATGAWWGAKVTVKGGEKIVRIVVAAAAVMMALKLFSVY
ncbi:sulfite exporter TauE/SafE family protein [candidate division KSB1 bacterium]|nr:sulfite exporter TauE/SafE family protein [candidate division KSB1 bacterium]